MGWPLIAAKVAGITVFLSLATAATHSHCAEPGAVVATRALNADLLAHDSATEVLGRLCAMRHLADPPTIRAVRDTRVDKPADSHVRALLQLRPDEPVRYRRVRLVCGSHVLSNADNWYVPDRLTADMNRKLDQTDTPFGLVVRPLGYHRVRMAARVLLNGDGQPRAGQDILRHEALLIAASGRPLSFVAETYTSDAALVMPPGR